MLAAGVAVVLELPRAHAAAPAAAAPIEGRYDHRQQLGLGIMPGLGYRAIIPYEEHNCGDSSGDASKRVCTGAVPFFVDAQLAYGLTAGLDLLLDARFGVAAEPVTGSHTFALAPGVRFWLSHETPGKFYIALQGLYDRTDHHDVVPTSDFGVRNENGFMYDIHRNLGLYFQFGETLGLVRWFRLQLDVGLGVQARLP
jgi:hypothetical protein